MTVVKQTVISAVIAGSVLLAGCQTVQAQPENGERQIGAAAESA